MTREEYNHYKQELLKRKTYPYIFHNLELAKEFYSKFHLEVPTSKIQCYESSQAITYDKRAENRLYELRGEI